MNEANIGPQGKNFRTKSQLKLNFCRSGMERAATSNKILQAFYKQKINASTER